MGALDCPVVLDVDFGHTQPFMPFATGSLATVTLDGDRQELTQRLV